VAFLVESLLAASPEEGHGQESPEVRLTEPPAEGLGTLEELLEEHLEEHLEEDLVEVHLFVITRKRIEMV
jgi:hypothetical protein